MNKLSKHHFWAWFMRHSNEYLDIKNKPKKEAAYLLNEMNAHLRAYFKFLGFTLEFGEETATLTITVNGNKARFKKVDDFIAKAPTIPGWSIEALEGPRPIDFFLEQQIAKTGIDPRELSFSFAGDNPPHAAGLTVYHPLCTNENHYLIYDLAYNAVYNLLGERVFGKYISFLDVANLSEAQTAEVEPLESLPAYIDQHRSLMVIDEKGNLVVNH